MNPEAAVLYGILVVMWIQNSWHFYITFRQRDVIKNTVTMPDDLNGILSVDTFSKARMYNLDRITFGIIHSFFDVIVTTAVLLLYVIPFFWKFSMGIAGRIGYENNEIVISIIFMLIVNTITILVSIPFQIYSTFVIEERYGFNKQTPTFYLKDLIKGYILIQILVLLLLAPIIYIVKVGGPYFFVYLWVFSIFLIVFFMSIYPDLIAPMFDKYTPLKDGELKTAIEELASSVNFPLTKIYVVEGSQRSAHSNAYFYGFFKNKRIVLFDTLLQDDQYKNNETAPSGETDESSETNSSTVVEKKGLSTDEIVAVLAHELGHWKGNHILKGFIITQINLFILYMGFSFLFRYSILYKSFGFYDSQPVLIGFIIIFQYIFSPYNFVMSFLITIYQRKSEFEADEFAMSLGKAEFLRSSLIKLNKDNLGFPVNDWLYSTFTFSHPPLLERLKALNKTE